MRGHIIRRAALAAVVAGVAVPAVVSAGDSLTVSGKVAGSAGQNLTVLLVGNNGTSVRVTPSASGSFSATVPAQVATSFRQSGGKGPTVHLLKNGKYGGPVVLGKKNSTTGYTRIAAAKGGKVSVGTIAMKTGYAVATAKSTVLDTKSSIRMKSSKPVSSGSVREAALFGPVRSFAALTDASAELGADADRDGLPNFADADANGDAILDAAQPDSSSALQGVAADKLLDRRPTWDFDFVKIVQDSGLAPVNSNIRPGVGVSDVETFLSVALRVEIAGNLDASQADTGEVSMWCKVSYCTPGSATTLVSPKPELMGKPIDTVRNADGSLALQRSMPTVRRALVFKPGDAVKGTNALTGDAFGFTTSVGGVLVANEIRVLTSGVVSPPAFVSAGTRTFAGEIQTSQAVRLTSDLMNAFPVTIHRAQDFADGSTGRLVDRGGLRYRFYMMSTGPNSQQWVCRPSGMSGLSATLVKPVDESPVDSLKAYLFDSEQMPAANGAKLSVTINLNSCFSAGPSTQPKPASGTDVMFYVDTWDSSGNQSATGIRLLIP